MRVGLIDVDGYHAQHRRRGDTFLNLAIMRIAAWNKAQGDAVVWALRPGHGAH